MKKYKHYKVKFTQPEALKYPVEWHVEHPIQGLLGSVVLVGKYGHGFFPMNDYVIIGPKVLVEIANFCVKQDKLL